MTRTATCRTCGKAIHYVARRFAWVHNGQADHGPIPGTNEAPGGHRDREGSGGMTTRGVRSRQQVEPAPTVAGPEPHQQAGVSPDNSTEGTDR